MKKIFRCQICGKTTHRSGRNFRSNKEVRDHRRTAHPHQLHQQPTDSVAGQSSLHQGQQAQVEGAAPTKAENPAKVLFFDLIAQRIADHGTEETFKELGRYVSMAQEKQPLLNRAPVGGEAGWTLAALFGGSIEQWNIALEAVAARSEVLPGMRQASPPFVLRLSHHLCRDPDCTICKEERAAIGKTARCALYRRLSPNLHSAIRREVLDQVKIRIVGS